VTVVVADATSLERNLNLVLQTMEVTDRVVLCVNSWTKPEKRIRIDLNRLEEILGIPLLGSAREAAGTELLLKKISELAEKKIHTTPLNIPYGT
jgi:ferrous iron transport protein B